MSEAVKPDIEELNAAIKSAIEEFNADLADGFERYHAIGDPACRMDGIIEQLWALLEFSERWADPPSRLQPLRDHLHDLMDLQHGMRPKGLNPPDRGRDGHPPVPTATTMRRARAVALMELELQARGDKGEQAAADAAKAAFPGVQANQIKSWRKRAQAKKPRDPALRTAYETCLTVWTEQYPGDPAKAAAALKKALKQQKNPPKCA